MQVSMRSIPLPKLLALALLGPLLCGCNGPSDDDVARAIGARVSNVSCSAASGQPGYVCTYSRNGLDITDRFIKREDGRWDFVH